MTRRDDENEEKPKSLLGRLFRREKGRTAGKRHTRREPYRRDTAGRRRAGGTLRPGAGPDAGRGSHRAEARAAEACRAGQRPQPEPEKPQKPAEPIKAPEPPAPSRRKSRQKSRLHPGKRRSSTSHAPAGAVRGPGDAGAQSHAVWCKASAAGGRASPAGEARKTGKEHPGSSGHCSETGRRKRAGCSAGEACRADARDGVCRRQGVEAPCGPGDAVLRQGRRRESARSPDPRDAAGQ